jgi:hypothetical protein
LTFSSILKKETGPEILEEKGPVPPYQKAMITRTQDSHGPASAQPSIFTGWVVPRPLGLLVDVPLPAFPGIPEPVAIQERETDSKVQNQTSARSRHDNFCFWYWELDDADLSLAAIGVLTLLARCSFPALETIARTRRISTRTVQRAIAELEAKGLVVVKRTFGEVNQYRLRSISEWQIWKNQSQLTHSAAVASTQYSGALDPRHRSTTCCDVVGPGAVVSGDPRHHSTTKKDSSEKKNKKERERPRAGMACAKREEQEIEEGAAAPTVEEQQSIPALRPLVSNNGAAAGASCSTASCENTVADPDLLTPLQMERFKLGLTVSGKATRLQYEYLKESLTQAEMNRLFTGFVEDEQPTPVEPPKPPTAPTRAAPLPNSEPMMDGETLARIARDPLYKDLDVQGEAWQFKRYCVAKNKLQTVMYFKCWLARCKPPRRK